jgi:restriction system protein
MARRGFFAELQHQAKVSARDAERAQAARVRQHSAAVRESERAQKAAQRAAAQAARASAAERKQLEKAAKEAHQAAMQAIVDQHNGELESVYEEIDSLLAATLDVDDFVDLEALRQTVEHPPFDKFELETPTPPPPPIPDPVEPQYLEPPAPSGLFGKKKKHEAAIATARAEHEASHRAWEAELALQPGRREAAAENHAKAEELRVQRLEAERARYAAECAAREAEVAEQNAALDALIANLGYGTTEAVEEYISIVLSNSVYPEHVPVGHEFTFDPASAELALRCLVPGPDKVPATKAFKYAKAADEVTETALPQKAVKDRYAGAVNQVALRSLHEVFEADRRGLIQSIALQVGTETIDPATGIETYVPFVAVGADRATFTGFDLAAVVPSATLSHLGAAVSKNPHGLVPADLSGIRKA